MPGGGEERPEGWAGRCRGPGGCGTCAARSSPSDPARPCGAAAAPALRALPAPGSEARCELRVREQHCAEFPLRFIPELRLGPSCSCLRPGFLLRGEPGLFGAPGHRIPALPRIRVLVLVKCLRFRPHPRESLNAGWKWCFRSLIALLQCLWRHNLLFVRFINFFYHMKKSTLLLLGEHL